MSGRKPKISEDYLTKLISPYILFKNHGISQVYVLIKNDEEVAAEISTATGIKINRNQIVYYRRKNNIAACGENHGGRREGAGRKKEYVPIPVYDGTIVIDYADTSGALALLHQLDTWRLSRSVIGQGLTGGVAEETAEFKRLKEISVKLKKANPGEKIILEREIVNIGLKILGEKRLEEILKTTSKETVWDVKEVFDEATTFENGKINKNGNRSNSQLARLCS